VRIVWDEHAVPYLTAENESDLFAAQGFLHAQERLWQMDFSRRFFSGRMAEIFGARPVPWSDFSANLRDKTIVDLDFFVRLMGIQRTAASSFTLLADKFRALLEAYSRGVNHYIETHRKSLPLEFRLLRYEPEPWKPQDCLLIAKGLALVLSTALMTRLALIALAQKLGDQEHKLRSLYPAYPHNDPCITQLTAGSSKELLAFLSGTFLATPRQGSNSWVVGPALSSTGKPILCNDTHLRMNLPPLWYLMDLKAHGAAQSEGDFMVSGVTLPGSPCVYIGHNATIAWGITAALCDDADLYEEKIHPQDEESYLTAGGWEKLQCREERIQVRGASAVTRIVRSTRHGPLLSDFTAGQGPHQALALKWTGHEAALELQALYGLNRARDWSDFLASVELHVAPTLNYVYADISGNIGYCLAGKIPARTQPSLLPLPGWHEDSDWRGYIPFAELPRLYNPPEGVIATANNSVADPSYPYHLSDLFEPPYRIRRIKELLTTKSVYSLSDMAAIQLDVISTLARSMVAAMREDLQQIALKETALAEVVRSLLAWDGSCSERSYEAALFHVFYQRLMVNILEPDLGGELLQSYAEIFNQSLIPLEQILRAPDSPWFEHVARIDFVHQSLRETIDFLRRELGPDKRDWSWGKLHTLTLRHALGQQSALARFFSVGPIPASGDGVTINIGFYSHAHPYSELVGPALRMIVDVSNWDNSKFVLISGQSGHPFSKHYRDQFALWQTGRYISLAQDPKRMSSSPLLVLTPET
jgi:penicillin amidase